MENIMLDLCTAQFFCSIWRMADVGERGSRFYHANCCHLWICPGHPDSLCRNETDYYFLLILVQRVFTHGIYNRNVLNVYTFTIIRTSSRNTYWLMTMENISIFPLIHWSNHSLCCDKVIWSQINFLRCDSITWENPENGMFWFEFLYIWCWVILPVNVLLLNLEQSPISK